jgi:hypothetical protein
VRPTSRLAYPRLDVPVFQHTSIFRAVDLVLRNDPTFGRACNTFLAWTGSADDTKDPALSLCPYCRISPIPASSSMATERQHTAPLAVAIEAAVQGTDFDQLGNFWGLIWAVFFDMSDMARFNGVVAILQAAGVTRPVMTMQGFGYTVDNENNYMLVGRGTIMFNSLLPR